MHRPSCATEQLAQVSKDRYVEFRSILPSASAKPHQVQPRVHQSPPPPDLFKIIYDGAVFADKNKSGIGMVIQDNHGLVIASLVQHKLINRLKLKPWQPLELLSLDWKQALTKLWWKKIPLQQCLLWKKDDVGLAPFGLLVKDGIRFVQFFSQLTYSHTKREDNKVTHNLAMLAINYLTVLCRRKMFLYKYVLLFRLIQLFCLNIVGCLSSK